MDPIALSARLAHMLVMVEVWLGRQDGGPDTGKWEKLRGALNPMKI